MRACILIFSILFFSQDIFSQCQFEVNNGEFEYSVNVQLAVSNVIYSQEGTTCNVQFEVDYDIELDISNAPPWWDENLWVLQGNFTCVDGSGNSFFDLPNGGGSGKVTSATFSFNNMNCSDVTLDCPITINIQGPGGLNTAEPCGTYEEFGVVPVVLKSFTANDKVEATLFSWETSSEVNFSHFELESSLDAKSWEIIEELEGRNNPNGSIYSYERSFQSKPYYIRLVMVDFDGYTDYSDIIYVSSNRLTSGEIGMFPNPATHNVHFDNLPTDSVANVYDLNGRFRFREHVSNDVLDISRLTHGQYIVKLEIPDRPNEYRKLLVL